MGHYTMKTLDAIEDPFEKQIVANHLWPLFNQMQRSMEGKKLIDALTATMMLAQSNLNQIAKANPSFSEDPSAVLLLSHLSACYGAIYQWCIDTHKREMRENN